MGHPAYAAHVESRPALRRVLVATDLARHASDALARAAMLPLADGARIELLHVASEDANRDHARELLEAVAASIAPKTIVRVVGGVAWTEIVRASRAHAAELVVLGAHSKRGGWFTLGSTAQEVVRRGSSPVLVVRHPAVRPYRRPLVAIDLSDVSRSVLDAARLAVDDDVPLRVLHAYHVPFEGTLSLSSSRAEIASIRRHYRDEARRLMAAFLSASETHGAGYEATVRRGEASGVILRELVTRRTDLLVLGTHGRTGLSRLILGSVAQTLLDHAPCDVLVGRPERFALDGS